MWQLQYLEDYILFVHELPYVYTYSPQFRMVFRLKMEDIHADDVRRKYVHSEMYTHTYRT